MRPVLADLHRQRLAVFFDARFFAGFAFFVGRVFFVGLAFFVGFVFFVLRVFVAFRVAGFGGGATCSGHDTETLALIDAPDLTMLVSDTQVSRPL